MLVDTKGMTKDLEGKRLQVVFNDGTDEVIKLEAILTFDCHESCNGFMYQVLESNRPELVARMARENPNGFSCWGNFQDVVSWRVLKEDQ